MFMAAEAEKHLAPRDSIPGLMLYKICLLLQLLRMPLRYYRDRLDSKWCECGTDRNS